nr:hypothetical protein [bacterium]
ISPTRQQLVHGQPRDARLAALLRDAGLRVTYLLDEAQLTGRPADERAAWYSDELHLTRPGHRAWARVFGAHLRQPAR